MGPQLVEALVFTPLVIRNSPWPTLLPLNDNNPLVLLLEVYSLVSLY